MGACPPPVSFTLPCPAVIAGTSVVNCTRANRSTRAGCAKRRPPMPLLIGNSRMRVASIASHGRPGCLSRSRRTLAVSCGLHGDVPLLEVQCRHCSHGEVVDFAEVIWPRERPIHTLRRALYCRLCQAEYGRKRRPALVGLRMRNAPVPTAPASVTRKATE